MCVATRWCGSKCGVEERRSKRTAVEKGELIPVRRTTLLSLRELAS